MTAPFRLYGAELSPYSIKVRSYLRFKGVEFEWLPRTNARQEEFQRYAKLPLIPVLVGAVEATGAILEGDVMGRAGGWMRLLAVFDVIFLTASFLAFEHVIGD